MSVNRNGEKLIVSRRKAKILAVNRKCSTPLRPSIKGSKFRNFETDRLMEGDRLIRYRFNNTGSAVLLVLVLR